MIPKGTKLLCLVLCLGQRIQAQDRNFSIPTISAVPGSVVPWNETVKILCKGAPESYLYHLKILRNSKYQQVNEILGYQKEAAVFTIHPMDANSAGNYRCQYRSYKGWSEHSDALDLVVTGFYDKPFLSADQDHRVAPGENFSLRCSSASIPFDRFSLTKDGGVDLPQQQNGGHQGSFTLGPVNYNFSGNYRCYGWYNASPHVWSSPSNTLELVVTDTMNQDYTMENLIRMIVAGLVLVALLAILAEDWHSRRVLHKEGRQDLAETSCSKQKCQTEWTLQPAPNGHL
uniref:Fc alpha receptor n=2 Tax=Loxodonta africana TaxID=9785 RepID=G3TSF2_LOXAF